MTEITRANFEAKIGEIFEAISSASFVAFDCEFTGLNSGVAKPQVSDTPDIRYRKYVTSTAVPSIISQIGLSCFTYDQNLYQYTAKTYNFYLCPRSIAGIDSEFSMQPSSLEFLTRFNFDFNKFLYAGIPYITKDEEDMLRRKLAEGTLFQEILDNLSPSDTDTMQAMLARISSWMQERSRQQKLDDLMKRQKSQQQQNIESDEDLNQHLLLDPGHTDINILHCAIRKWFPGVWTFDDENGGLGVILVTPEERQDLEKAESWTVSLERIIQHYIGFTRVFHHIVRCEKPLVGHNCLLDLKKITAQFVGQLPSTFSQFKQQLHSQLPVIIDTKVLAYATRREVCQGGSNRELFSVLRSTNLQQLFTNLTADGEAAPSKPGVQPNPHHTKCRDLLTSQAGHSPPEIIRLEDEYCGGGGGGEERRHEAGFDALAAGTCFVLLGHLTAGMKAAKKRGEERDRKLRRATRFDFREMLFCVKEYQNCLNMARASVHHVRLDGGDPAPCRPHLLHITARTGHLDMAEVAAVVSRYGSCDVGVRGRDRAVVAFTGAGGANQFLKAMRKSEVYKVETFSQVRHSPRVRAFLWAGFCLSLTLTIRHIAIHLRR